GAAGGDQPRQQGGLLLQMLDLDGRVVADAGKLPRERVDDGQRVRGAVEEVRIAEGDVLRAGGYLRANVGEHDIRRHRAEPAVVERDDRAGSAAMIAAARRFP